MREYCEDWRTYEHCALWGMHPAVKSLTEKTASAETAEAATTARRALVENCILMVGLVGWWMGLDYGIIVWLSKVCWSDWVELRL